ncbi:MAG: dynamin family protein [Myxococcales bacterium]|nr:dynamin family protein [Myxococcales bacterium]
MAEPPSRPAALFERVERFLDGLLPPSDEVTSIVKRGEALLAAGDPDGALRAAENAVAAAPLFLRAIQLRADALFAKGEAAQALAVLTDAARERALPSISLARMCEYAAAAGDDRRSLDLATQARTRTSDRDPTTARHLLSAARLLVARGSHSAALHLARSATVVDPKLGEAWLLLARDALVRSDSAQCARALAKATPTLDAANGALNREAGELALAIGDFATASRHLRRAWLVGEQDAIAPLVLTLYRARDSQGLERVVAEAEGALAELARALVNFGHGDAAARSALDATHGGAIADALWPLALETALASAPEVAERWANEAPTRAGAAAVLALAEARTRGAELDPVAALDVLAPAFSDERTSSLALERFRAVLTARWSGRLPEMLDDLAALARAAPVLAQTERDLRTRRRELDEPLRVALLGEFSAGKSTFLNALIGAAVSPMGVLPTTAHVHWLRFGERSARVVDAKGTSVVCTIDAAPSVVERARESGAGVDFVEVTWPAPRLARVELIDTPGFNAGDAAHERAVRSAFSMADLALWLFDARQAGKMSETGPLEEARDEGLPVLGVLNKIDQVKAQDLSRLAAIVRDGFRELAPLAVSVSAREALAAQVILEDTTRSDDERTQAKIKLATSGFASLLAWIDEHLVAQRAGWKLLRVARRTALVLDEATALLDAASALAQQRDDRRDALLAMVSVLREQLPGVLNAVRREVATVLVEQLRGLQRRDRAKAQELTVLAADAAAEVTWRVRQRVLSELGGGLVELERLAIEAGIVVAESSAMITALVVQAIDHAAADGARDAAMGSPPFVPLPSDPFATIEQAVLRVERREAGGDQRVRAALEVAREMLSSYRAPAVTLSS